MTGMVAGRAVTLKVMHCQSFELNTSFLWEEMMATEQDTLMTMVQMMTRLLTMKTMT